MTSNVAENLSSAPTTPTTPSTASMSELSFEDITIEHHDPMPATDVDSAQPTTIDHPVYYYADGLVTIHVEHTRFRIPRAFLTRDSLFFRSLLCSTTDEEIFLTEKDVTSTAFESLLQLLFPPEYGVCPIESLDRWTGALHLANKWGFEAIRDAAVKAILPLASSVDKIVLGRRYNLFTWVSPAFVELLERDEDLSMEEAKLLELEDVVMIGKGRLQARRVSGIRSTTDIKTIVAKLLPDETLVYGEVPLDKSGSLDEREHDAATHRSPAPSDVNDFEVDAQEAVEACMRMSSNGSLPSEALLCIDDFIAKGSGHASTAVTAVLDYLWARYDLHWRASITQNPAPVYIGAEGRLLLHLKRRMVSKAFDDIVSNYCINRIAAWKGLFHSSVVDQDDLTLDAWTTSKGLDSLPVALLNMASAARFIRYIIDTNLVADGCLPLNWCAKFWWRLEGVFEVLWAAGAPGLNNRLVTILTLTGQSVFFNMKSLKLFYKCVNAACVQNAWNPDSDAHSAIRDDLISPTGLLKTQSWLKA